MTASTFNPAESCTFAVAHGQGTDTVSVHYSTGVLLMLALGLDRPQHRRQIAGNLHPADLIARAVTFRWAVETGLVPDQDGVDVDDLVARLDQVVAIAEQAQAAGSRVTFA